ncbi:hypothetical protein EMIHUDRAFT_220816 [Emiliania huxleyi CCMP1516]|uniref:Hydroxyproline O-arabinosyltransferase-like domain-containing protein n=2 Tax=Emiliania huxleyi TaxID=2903 RepID=A0A0D3I0B0_EMIH1|nr:hypothetical protein EMIHUDRAFT_220816 [Emiliania huxleyi CCMP1516]EOD04695.1 hypothetical protein EMIHUDRAFT_220816 [Emiliania huxleyi CCMP1516]|eukprot:XP_005757124.1 hypothetical protein EMIHUDRAFT_220816 [Emiliania huxleyi CCMP1516]
MRLRAAAAGLVPFLLVALYWQHASSSAAGSDRALVRQQARDVALDWGPPTLSSKRIIDGSPNYLPVPNAEGPAPDDMAWRKEVSSDPSVPCPAGRRPYHTILTAQGSLYQQWQTKIFYYHFRKQQAAGGRCTEMTGFTRLLAGKPDELMPTIPTVAVPEAGHNVTRGFPVINRPWSMLLFIDMKEFRERIIERYDPKSGGIAQKWLPDTKVADMPPVGPSPILIHVDLLRAVTPLWYELSWKLKRDPEANAAYGWMLEMWGYSIAAARLESLPFARLKIKHFVWQRIQIEPSAAWHQTLSERDGDWAPAVDPFIYHYTFGVEYLLDGSPVVGGKGTWSLDKRNYFGAAPPPDLKAPPECAQEAGRVWWGMFNEAIGNLTKEGQWYGRTGQSTRSRTSDESTELEAAMGALGKELVDGGQWLIGNEKAPLQFFRRGKLWTKWGGGTWRVTGGTKVHVARQRDKHAMKLWVPMRHVSMEYTGWRDSGGCKL